ncbi:MAG: flavodoxin [Lentimicrobium sp.]|nr:flavodoxin [Lentimicrobium sp.]
MKTAIVYRSHHGTTEKVANMISEEIGKENTRLFNLKKEKLIDLSKFDRVIIGGSIHAGSIQKSVKEFCAGNMVALLEKPLGLFLSCMEDQKAREQFDSAYPELLRSHARSCKITGGEFNFDKMNFLEKAIIRKVSGIKESVSKINESGIKELVSEMNA